MVKQTSSGIKFDLLAANREVIATSEVYNSKASCMKGIASVMKNAPIASVEDQTAKEVKKEINPKVKSIMSNIGMLLLFGLMIAVTLKDIIKLFMVLL